VRPDARARPTELRRRLSLGTRRPPFPNNDVGAEAEASWSLELARDNGQAGQGPTSACRTPRRSRHHVPSSNREGGERLSRPKGGRPQSSGGENPAGLRFWKISLGERAEPQPTSEQGEAPSRGRRWSGAQGEHCERESRPQTETTGLDAERSNRRRDLAEIPRRAECRAAVTIAKRSTPPVSACRHIIGRTPSTAATPSPSR